MINDNMRNPGTIPGFPIYMNTSLMLGVDLFFLFQ